MRLGTVLLLFGHFFHIFLLLLLFGRVLGKRIVSWQILLFFLMSGFELLMDAAIERFSLSHVLGIAHSFLCLIPLLWIGRKRLLESLFSIFMLLHYLTVISYLDLWLFQFFIPVYGPAPTAFCILLVEGGFGGLLVLYFKRIILPMMQINGNFAGTGKLWIWLIPAAFYLISIYSCLSQDFSGSYMGFTVGYMVLNMILDLFICWSTGNFLRESEQRNELENERQLFSIMRKQYEGILERLEQARQMRHDMRHFVIRVNGLLQDGDIEGIRDYLLEYSAALSQSSLKNIAYCSNSTVNAVAGYYLLTAEEEGIETSFDCRVDGKLPVSELEISGLLGNILENALEACRRMESGKRYIHVTLRSEADGFLVFVVENSYNGIVRKKGERFLSAKRNEPGTGLESVKNSVGRRNGICKIEYDDRMFRVNVFMG